MISAFTHGLLQRLGIIQKHADANLLFPELLTNITKDQFAELITLYIAQALGSGANEEKQKLMETLQEDFKNWFRESLELILNSKGDLLYDLARLVDPQEQAQRINRFVDEASAIFIERRHEKQLMNYLAFPEAISALALALQDTTLGVPLHLYRGKDVVSPEAEGVMREILQRIENIRSNFGLKGFPGVDTTLGKLYNQIGIADDYVWLPVRPLITAPLAEVDMQLYARSDETALRLAHQIVNGDGVILITGYRGVGKSTFINATLTHIERAEAEQMDDSPWKVVPVQMNVAKASNVEGALRLCIRAIYRTFSQTEKWKGILNAEEQRHLEMANLRASFKVSMSQAEALSISKSLQAEFGFNFGDLLTGPVKTFLSGLLPKLTQKTTKEWNRKVDSTVSLLDYDEDRAEEDIVRFIAMLSEPRLIGQKETRLKLLFIFDELDKMEAKQGQEALIRQLKNLFLARNTVFLLVTSKEFYYLLLEDRKKEDSILGSYFSSVITVPLFDSASTHDLLMKLLTDNIDLHQMDQTFIKDLARYLTYRAHGLPREIIRELRGMQQLVKGTLVSYLSDRTIPSGAIQVYAQIQDVIENLNTSTEVETTSEAQAQVVRERVWLTEGRQEQIRRSLYVLIEDMLNQGYLTLRSDPAGYASYQSNFSTVSFEDFRDIFDQLTRSLARMRLPDDPTGAALFVRQGVDPKEDYTISVEPVLYKLTGRQILQRDRKPEEPGPELSPEELFPQVQDFLKQDSLLAARRALLLLGQIKDQPIPDELQDTLYRLFTSSKDISFRLDAAKYLSSERFYANVQKNVPDQFLKTEINDQILNAFMKLVYDGATNKSRREKAQEIIDKLLTRYEGESAAMSLSLLNNLALEAPSIFKDKAGAQGILDRILKRFNPSETLPETLLSALQSLAVAAESSLPVELIRLEFSQTLPAEHLNRMMRALSMPQLMKIWKDARARKSNPLNHAVMVITLLMLVNNLPDTGSEIENWLAFQNWDEQDSSILRDANTANPKLYYELERIFSGKKKSSPTFIRVSSLIGPAQAASVTPAIPQAPAKAEQEPAKSDQFENPWWLNMLTGGIFFVIFLMPNWKYANPTETRSTLATIIDRLLQLTAFSLIVIFISLVVVWIVSYSESKKASRAEQWGYGIGCVAVLGIDVGLFGYLFKTNNATLGGQFFQLLMLVCTFVVPLLAQGIIRFVISLFKPKVTVEDTQVKKQG